VYLQWIQSTLACEVNGPNASGLLTSAKEKSYEKPLRFFRRAAASGSRELQSRA